VSDYNEQIARALAIRDQAIKAGLTCPHAIAALILGESIALALKDNREAWPMHVAPWGER